MNAPSANTPQIHDDLHFVVVALLTGAINLREFRRWISRVIEQSPAEDLPDILFDLMEINDQLVMQRARGLSARHAASELTSANSPLQALAAIAYLRDPSLGKLRHPELTALKARATLTERRAILERFETLFPTIVLPLSWKAP